MQPVPVQRSRMRRGVARGVEERTRVARWVVMVSVSGLWCRVVSYDIDETYTIHRSMTDLGIKTPLLHNISNSPNGCVPSIYCNGFPLARSTHIRYKCRGHDVRIWPADVRVTWRLAMACSRSQRSSLRADGR